MADREQHAGRARTRRETKSPRSDETTDTAPVCRGRDQLHLRPSVSGSGQHHGMLRRRKNRRHPGRERTAVELTPGRSAALTWRKGDRRIRTRPAFSGSCD